MAAIKRKYGARLDLDLDAEHLKELAGEFLAIVKRHTGKPFPQDPYEQLEIAIGAVFRSWMGKRAVDYRKQFRITPDMANGTAVNICTMVFGNMGNDSGTGVGFTRNPGTGENVIYGEYLVNAQGEDVVAGIRTPKPIAEMEQEMPEIYRQLMELHNRLESHYQEVQDFEFTIEKGTLYCLQTRNGKMNARAMVRTSVEMFNEGLISKERALLRIEPHDAGAAAGAAAVAELPRQVAGAGPAGLARRGLGQDRVRCRYRRDARDWPAKKSSWCARRPSRRTSTASSRRRASSPAAAARPRTRRWWRAAWASPACPAASRS